MNKSKFPSWWLVAGTVGKEQPTEILEEIKQKNPTLKVGDVIGGDIVYKVDDEYVYLVTPATRRFLSDWDTAVEKCKDLDYELPSNKDLQKIYELRNEIDVADKSSGKLTLEYFVSNTRVWSSTEYSTNYAWGLTFFNGILNATHKSNTYFVVPVKKLDWRI